MQRKKPSKTPPMAATLEEIVCMLVEEQTQHETELARHEREVQAQMTTMCEHMQSLVQVMNDLTATARLPHCTLHRCQTGSPFSKG